MQPFCEVQERFAKLRKFFWSNGLRWPCFSTPFITLMGNRLFPLCITWPAQLYFCLVISTKMSATHVHSLFRTAALLFFDVETIKFYFITGRVVLIFFSGLLSSCFRPYSLVLTECPEYSHVSLQWSPIWPLKNFLISSIQYKSKHW